MTYPSPPENDDVETVTTFGVSPNLTKKGDFPGDALSKTSDDTDTLTLFLKGPNPTVKSFPSEKNCSPVLCWPIALQLSMLTF